MKGPHGPDALLAHLTIMNFIRGLPIETLKTINRFFLVKVLT